MKAFWVNYCEKKHGKWDDTIEDASNLEGMHCMQDKGKDKELNM